MIEEEDIGHVIEKNAIEDEGISIQPLIKKKVTINEENNTEKIIEEIKSNVVKDTILLKNEFCLNLIKLVSVLVSRGIFKPNEVGNVGRSYVEFKSQLNLNEDDIESYIKISSLNNFKILIEIGISRGAYVLDELADVGDVYNNLVELLNIN